ncbi:hypothetical protein SLS63_003593 [Diaporthe eres]|uniref:Major facilitator superfamily (MFS) profile domain-containing protein n=1 Tax=Diaporthe eres TaxID=83184 RepID=A0ABR1PGS7_DIAER
MRIMANNTVTDAAQADEKALQSAPQKNRGDPSLDEHQDPDAVTRDDDDYPEGGAQAWLAITGSFLVYFASFGVINSFGFFQTFYQQDYLKNYSPSAISFIGTLQITLMYLSGSVAGALFDVYGSKWLYMFAAFGGAGSMLATSFAQPNAIWQQFLAQSLLFGITVAYGVQPALTVAGQYFKRKRALAMGIVASGSSIGGVCLPIMFSKLIRTIGFAWSMRVGALILLVCYAIAIAICRPARPRTKLVALRHLLDYRGFLDIRYACLSVGAVISSLGVYVPFYYIAEDTPQTVSDVSMSSTPWSLSAAYSA